MNVDNLRVGNEVVTKNTEKARILGRPCLPNLPAIIQSTPTRSTERGTPLDHRDRWIGGGFQPRRFIDPYRRMTAVATIGVDNLSVKIVQICFEIIASLLTKMFNEFIALSYSPASWRVARVLALRKPGKSDYTKANTYTPISLLSHLGKNIGKCDKPSTKNFSGEEQKSVAVSSRLQTRPPCSRRLLATSGGDNWCFSQKAQVQAVSLVIKAADDWV